MINYRKNFKTSAQAIEGNSTALALESFLNSKVAKNIQTTKSKSPTEQFAFWREVGEGIGVIDRPDPYNNPFGAQTVSYITSSVYYARFSCAHSSSICRDKRYAEQYGSETLIFQLRMFGTELDNDLGTGEYFKPGDIRVFDLSQTISSVNPAFENISIAVQKKDLIGRFSNPESLHGKILPAMAMTSMLRSYMQTVLCTVPDLSIGQCQPVNEATFDMLHAAIMGSLRPGILDSEDTDSAGLQAVRIYIEHNLENPDLSPDLIAINTAMSRSKLFRICRPYGTPMELVRHRRMRRAADYLRSNATMTIEQISFAVGYRNRESFSRAFKAEFGLSPKEFSER